MKNDMEKAMRTSYNPTTLISFFFMMKKTHERTLTIIGNLCRETGSLNATPRIGVDKL